MIVDVLYEGLTLAKGVEARSEVDALFVELESPMPVGTRLIVRSPDGEKPARVESVAETGKLGVLVRYSGNISVITDTPVSAPAASAPSPTSAPAAPASAPTPAAAPTPETDDDGDKDPQDKKGGRKRRNTRKTVLGH